MSSFILTAGGGYSDIDTLAGCLAYQEILRFQGHTALSVLPGSLNLSVTPAIKSWPLDYLTTPPSGNFEFIIIDLSEPSIIVPFVDHSKITEIFDHHFGFEDHWRQKLGNYSHIETVGAVATLIWEEYQKRGLAGKISTLSANLLSTAIISNTLNFKSSVTTSRDLHAYNQLKKYSDLPVSWPQTYLQEVESHLFDNPIQAVIEDTKRITYPNLPFPLTIGQIELWDSRDFTARYQPQIKQAITSYGPNPWFLTSPSISQGINYLYTDDPQAKELLKKLLKVEFFGDIAVTTKLWLRKEILKLIKEKI